MEYATGRAALLRRPDDGAVRRRCPTTDRATFAFDTSVIDWPHYFIEVHCPAVTAPIRRLDELRALRKKPAAGELAAASAPAATGHRGVLRHGRDAAVLQRDRDLPLAAAARARRRRAARPSSAGSRPRCRAWCRPSAAQRSDFLRARLPRVRRRPARRPRRGRRRAPHRPRPVPALARRRAPDPRAPRRRAPDRADHRRDPAADPAAAAAVRPHRGRRPRRRRPRRLHRPPGLVAAGRGVAGRLDAVLRRRARHRHEGVLRLRRLPLRPAAAGGGRQPGRGPARRPALPARPPLALGRSSTGPAPTGAARALDPAREVAR